MATIIRVNPALPPQAQNLADAARCVFAQAAAWACCSEISGGDGPRIEIPNAPPWAPTPRALWARALVSSGSAMTPDTWAWRRVVESYAALAEAMRSIGGVAPFGSGRRHAQDSGGKIAQACTQAVHAALAAAATRTSVDPLTGAVGPEALTRQALLDAAWPFTWFAVRIVYATIMADPAGPKRTWDDAAAAIVGAVAREWAIPIHGDTTGIRCDKCWHLRIVTALDHPARPYACGCRDNDACPKCGGWGDECACGLEACRDCGGTGLAYEPPSPDCDTCEGYGWIALKTPPEAPSAYARNCTCPDYSVGIGPDPDCDQCHGTGTIPEPPCDCDACHPASAKGDPDCGFCGGSGVVPVEPGIDNTTGLNGYAPCACYRAR